jgi:DNA-binding MarR family transcriptional regulator
MNNHYHEVLSHFGLTDNEIKIYLEAIKHNATSPFELARLTKIPRTTVYDVLMNLSLKGLVTLTQSDGLTKQQTKIKANNPSVLRQYIHERQSDLASLDVDLVDILPDLKQSFHKSSASADFQFLPGIAGAKEVYFHEQVSDNPLPLLAFENMMSMDAFGKAAINQDVEVITHTAPRQIKELIALTDWTKHVLTYQYARNPNYIKVREMRCLDLSGFIINQRITIQGNRICITCVDHAEAWGLRFNSHSLATTFSSIFQSLWTFATPITDDFVQRLGKNAFFEAETS